MSIIRDISIRAQEYLKDDDILLFTAQGSYRVFSKHYSDMAFHVISMEIRERDKGKPSFYCPDYDF